jgi:hypothetical protein
MFQGEDSMRIRTFASFETLCDQVADALDRLGDVSVNDAGKISVRRPRITAALSDVKIRGWLDEGKREGEYELTVRYDIVPSVGAWIIGVLLLPIGLIFPVLLPMLAKNQLDTAIRKAFDEIDDLR